MGGGGGRGGVGGELGVGSEGGNFLAGSYQKHSEAIQSPSRAIRRPPGESEHLLGGEGVAEAMGRERRLLRRPELVGSQVV